jgi:hypothetical protein
MKEPDSLPGSQEVPNTLRLARSRVASAEEKVEVARELSREAKRKRKEAKEAARRAKKRLQRAKDDLAEAQYALAEAEEEAARQARRAVSRQKLLRPLSRSKPPNSAHEADAAGPNEEPLPATELSPRPGLHCQIDNAPSEPRRHFSNPW